ncbi:MAG: polysaccharide deacetylase family protein [Flavisolibacter sp.]
MKPGLFIISLDFELLWGVRDKRTIANYGDNIRGVRQIIPALLRLFDAYDIHATFATVGFLFARDKDELLSHIPFTLPQYGQKKYSPYENQYLDSIGSSEKTDPYHYAPSLIKMIIANGNQEIASHTFSHYYCLENASLLSFEEDMKSAKNIAASYGVDLKSIVFPRNQYSEEHINVCKDLGFIAFRGNEQSSVYQPRKNEEQSKKIKAVRFADAYTNLTGHHSFKIDKGSTMLNIPASRFLRPYSNKLALLDPLRLKRICNSMSHAAEKREAYHLWWHPHNMGIHQKENLEFLEAILKHYQLLKQRYGMQSRTMKAIAEEILMSHGV